MLINKYFFTFLEKFSPSYFQYRNFMKISFSALITFSESYFLSVIGLNDIFYEIKDKTTKNEMIKIIRYEFVKIIIENSAEFTIRTISPDDFSLENSQFTGQNFLDKLKDFPLLIMTQSGQQSYSFIYNNESKVPNEIKILIISQSGVAYHENHLKNWIDGKDLKPYIEKNELNKLDEGGLINKLKEILGKKEIKKDPSYSVTLDNFYKMCLIIQRIRADIPIIIMGETGIGKTALIQFLVSILGDELETVNIHAGTNEKTLIERVEKINQKPESIKGEKKLWFSLMNLIQVMRLDTFQI